MKKIYKRGLGLLLALAIVLTCLVFTVTAADDATLKAERVTAAAGETVEVPITVRNNPGIAGMTLDVSFDSSALTLTEVRDGGILGVNTHKPELTSPYTLSWSNDTVTENLTENGVIATLRFSVSENAVDGEYPVTLSYDYDNYDIYNVDIEPVFFKTENGSVTVKTEKPIEAPTEMPTEAPAPSEAEDGAVLAAERVTVAAGETVEVPITVRNNPGIAGMTLDVSFDSSALTLTEVKDGGILGVNTHKPELTSPYTLSWSNDTVTENLTENGVIATLVFSVSANAVDGEYPVTLSYDYDNYDIYNVDIEPVFFKTESGSVTVNSDQPTAALLGDVDGDGAVTSVDVTLIQRYCAFFAVYVDESALMHGDVDKNDRIEIIDVTYIQRYLIGMETPYPIGAPCI